MAKVLTNVLILREMAVHVPYDSSLEQKFGFMYSPAVEACLALHCLAAPEHHGIQMPWIVEMREQLPRGLDRRLVEFGVDRGEDWIEPSNLVELGGFAPFEIEVARMRSMTAGQVRTVIIADNPWAESAEEKSEVRAIVDADPLAWRDEVCDLLEAFWPYFEPTWNRLERAFATELARLQRRHQEGMTLIELLPTLAPQIAWDEGEREFVIAKWFERRVDPLALEAFLVMPTYFGMPHMWVDTRPRFAIFYTLPDALGGAEPAAPEDLVPPLKALGEPTRLQMMALLLREPRSTQELAGMLHMSPPAVSRHLRTLSQVGLVRRLGRSESGLYVQYEADGKAARELTARLLNFLGDGELRRGAGAAQES